MSVLTFPTVALPELPSGQMAVVEALVGRAEVCQRLSVLGLTTGACLRVVMGGSPCAFELGASRLVLRGEMADAVRVTPLD